MHTLDLTITREFLFELTDPESDKSYVLLDLAWPYGLQEGLSDPVALLLNGQETIKAAASQAGYRFFTDVASFQSYIRQEILAV